MIGTIFTQSVRNKLMIGAVVLASMHAVLKAGDVPDASGPVAANAEHASAGKASIDDLGQLLDATFPGKNTITNNGQTYYTVNIQRDTWKFHLIVSLSPNGNVLWIDAPLTKMEDSANVSTDALVSILKKNADLGPIFFQINGEQMLELTEPIPNRDLSPERFKATIEAFLSSVRTTQPLWKKDAIMPAGAASATSATPAKNPLAR